MLPQFAELFPGGHGVVGCEGADYAIGVGRIEIALEEAVLETLRTGRKAEFGFARGFLDLGRPFDQLVVGQGIDISAFGQIFESLLVGGHDVGRLHPRHILKLIGAELGERVEGVALGAHTEIIKVDEIVGVHGRKVAVKRAQDADGTGIGLKLGLDACEPGAIFVGLVIDLARCASQHLFAHRLGFFDRTGLCRPEQDVGLCHGGRAQDGETGDGTGDCVFQSHEFLPRYVVCAPDSSPTRC